jgi:hypothetical protein
MAKCQKEEKPEEESSEDEMTEGESVDESTPNNDNTLGLE